MTSSSHSHQGTVTSMTSLVIEFTLALATWQVFDHSATIMLASPTSTSPSILITN